MTTISPIAQEAMELARRGDLKQAIDRAREAVEADPRDAGLRAFVAMLHIRRNELAEALPHLRAALATGPADPIITLELVRVFIGLGDLEEAETVLDRARLPGIEPVRLRALLLQRRGSMAEAGSLYRQVVASDPQDFESWGNLGVCLIATDQPKQALDALGHSLSLRPDRLSILHKWVEAHFMTGTVDQAMAELRERALRDPSSSQTWVAIAHGEKLLGRADESIDALDEALRRDRSNADALVAIAEAVEQRNDLERLEQILSDLAGLGQPVEKLPLLRARLAYRRGEFELALELARSSPPATDPGSRSQIIGQCLDRLGDPQAAFEAFVEMNAEDGRSGGSTARTADQSRLSLSAERELLTPEWIASWTPVTPPEQREPAFLVGFPRSGTTLLDTLLMGHPETAIAEEEPMLALVRKEAGELASLGDLEAGEVERLRRLYFDEAERHVHDARTGLLVDKNPLAMGSQAIIHRLFPTAPIIFMERHPCDVVMSCFMTRFQPTGIGTNFLTIEDTALLYDEMMRVWTMSSERLPLRVHTVRYERLVEDAEAELRPLAQFLGLEWLPALLDHQATVRKRSFIKTPSYSQVTEPVNARAVGRWVRYRKQLEPVIPILRPWVERMKYEI